MIKGIIIMKNVLERVVCTRGNLKNGWVTQITNDTVRSLFRQQIIETTRFI